MTPHFLAIDGGSQGAKVSIVDGAGRVQAAARVPLQPYELGPGGRAVHPGDDLWETVAQACRAALASFAGQRHDIAAVGLCGIRSCRVLIGADGRLTEPALSWMDERVSQPVGELDPDVATVASAGGYLTIRLTGNRRDSAANYDGIWPIDIERRQWSSDPALLARLGVHAQLLPDLVDPGELLGHVTAGAAAEAGLPAGLPVFATANDKASRGPENARAASRMVASFDRPSRRIDRNGKDIAPNVRMTEASASAMIFSPAPRRGAIRTRWHL